MHHVTSFAYRQLKAQLPVAAQWLTVAAMKAEQAFARELFRVQFYNHVVLLDFFRVPTPCSASHVRPWSPRMYK